MKMNSLVLLRLCSIAVLLECSSCGGPSQRQGKTGAEIMSMYHAIKTFYEEYGYYPVATNKTGCTDLSEVLPFLLGSQESAEERLLNPDAAVYLNLEMYRYTRDKGYRDPWGSFYNIAMITDPLLKVIVNDSKINDNIALWSNGPNKKNEFGRGDDIVSWTHQCSLSCCRKRPAK